MVHHTDNRYIVRVDGVVGGEPVIVGTRISVSGIVEYWRMGRSAEELTLMYPHITLAQVFDALSYFADHTDEINGYIAKNRIPEELISPLVRGR